MHLSDLYSHADWTPSFQWNVATVFFRQKQYERAAPRLLEYEQYTITPRSQTSQEKQKKRDAI